MVIPRCRPQGRHSQLLCKKTVKKRFATLVRRSGQLQNVTSLDRTRETDHVVEEINLPESEKEDEADESYEAYLKGILPESVLAEESLDVKEDEVVPGLGRKGDSRKGGPTAGLKYRMLYFDSQKKNEVLMKENQKLSQDLGAGLAKIEGLEESGRVCSVPEKLQDMPLLSHLGKATKSTMNLPLQGTVCRCSALNSAADPEVVDKRRGKGKQK